jgi:hypothetical protein
MQYMLMIHSDDSGFFAMKPAEQQQAMGAYMAYTEALRKAGALVGSNRLMPSADSTIVRVANGKSQVLNGPFTDSKEQLGGYYLIEAADLDAAIAWAARCPGAGHGAVEVRAIRTN